MHCQIPVKLSWLLELSVCPQSVLNLQGVLVNSGTGSYTFGISYKSGTMRLDSLVSLLINYGYVILQLISWVIALITVYISRSIFNVFFFIMEISFSNKLLTEVLIATCHSFSMQMSTFKYICAVKAIDVQRRSTCIPSGYKTKGRMIEKICQSIWVQFSSISV